MIHRIRRSRRLSATDWKHAFCPHEVSMSKRGFTTIELMKHRFGGMEHEAIVVWLASRGRYVSQ